MELAIASTVNVQHSAPPDDGHEILPVGGHGFSPGTAI
jgi:hypothetical protein